jgi:hypothetical protein
VNPAFRACSASRADERPTMSWKPITVMVKKNAAT